MRFTTNIGSLRPRAAFLRYVVASVAIGGAVFGLAGTADAACHGQDNNFNSWTTWAMESSKPVTCDNKNDYFGKVTDTSADGWKVRVETQFINGNAGWVPTANTGSSLSYNYSDDNSLTSFRLVRADGKKGKAGTNFGF